MFNKIIFVFLFIFLISFVRLSDDKTFNQLQDLIITSLDESKNTSWSSNDIVTKVDKLAVLPEFLAQNSSIPLIKKDLLKKTYEKYSILESNRCECMKIQTETEKVKCLTDKFYFLAINDCTLCYRTLDYFLFSKAENKDNNECGKLIKDLFAKSIQSYGYSLKLTVDKIVSEYCSIYDKVKTQKNSREVCGEKFCL